MITFIIGLIVGIIIGVAIGIRWANCQLPTQIGVAVTERIFYVCEGNDCPEPIPEEAYDALCGWRAEHDNDDLYIVCAKSAEGFEPLKQHGDFYVVRDESEERW